MWKCVLLPSRTLQQRRIMSLIHHASVPLSDGEHHHHFSVAQDNNHCDNHSGTCKDDNTKTFSTNDDESGIKHHYTNNVCSVDNNGGNLVLKRFPCAASATCHPCMIKQHHSTAAVVWELSSEEQTQTVRTSDHSLGSVNNSWQTQAQSITLTTNETCDERMRNYP